MPLSVTDLDAFINRHLIAKNAINGRMHKYKQEEVMDLLEQVKDVVSKTSMLARIKPPCIIVGDIHGQFYDLLRMFSCLTKEKINDWDDQTLSGALKYKFMFLGDYVDRGRHSLECVLLVFALKCRYPDKYQLLRGNHETRAINKEYGFYDEISDRFGEENADDIWIKFNEIFSWMPVAGLVGSRILCMHGGLSPHLTKLSDIEEIPRPLEDPPTNQLAMDLLWSDPMTNMAGYRFNTVRGVSVFFGEDVVHETCERLGIKLIVRAHQMMMTGYSEFANRKLITIFTAPRYQADLANSGAVLVVGSSGHLSYRILKPPQFGEELHGVGSDSGSLYFNREDKGTQKRQETDKKNAGKKAGSKSKPKKKDSAGKSPVKQKN